MKKIFTYLAVAALVAVACDDMYGPVETPTAPDKAGSVDIQIDTLGDDTLAFTIAPVGEASYYSYVVKQGKASAVDSTAVYQTKEDGLIKGTFKASEVASKQLTLGELAPNTAYTIYAVAGSLQGIPGSVAVKEVVTTDGITIKLVDYDDTVSDSTVVLTFSEKVYLGEGQITATYYARNLEYQEMGTVEAVADSVLVEGNKVTVNFAGLPHGADWSLAWPEGTFTDSAKNKVKALVAGQWAKDPETGQDVPVGVWSRRDTVSFELVDTLAKEQLMFNDWQTAVFSVAVASDSTLAKAGKGAATANYLTPGKKLTIDMTLNTNYMFGAGGIMMVCPEEPAFGTTIVFSFPQDSFQDIWGNPTKAVEYETLCAYDYTLADVIGTFKYVGADNVSQSYVQGELVIAASDDPEAGNVMLTSIAGITCKTPIYATFTPASGNLEIYGNQPFYGFVDDDGTQVDYVFYTYTNAYLHLSMTEAGVLGMPDDYFGVAIAYDGKLAAWQYLFLDFAAEKVGAEQAAALKSVSVPEFSKTLPLFVR